MLHVTPDEVRRMPIRDIQWLRVVQQSQNLAAEHLAKRQNWKKG